MRMDNSIQTFNTQFKFDNTFDKDLDLKKSDRVDHFGDFFDKAVSLLNSTSDIQKDVENKQIDFITGKSDDMIALSMAQARASSAIQFTSQVTNKVLNAYQEIMRIAI